MICNKPNNLDGSEYISKIKNPIQTSIRIRSIYIKLKLQKD